MVESFFTAENYHFNNHKFFVEIADNDEKRLKGLSHRAKLEKNEGMLFIFPVKTRHSFWMKGMNFPLDFVWIDGDTIADLTENVPHPSSGIADDQLTAFTVQFPVDKVLEINAGMIKSANIKIGDKLFFR